MTGWRKRWLNQAVVLFALVVFINCCLNPLECRGIILPRQTIWTWYTARWWVGCYIWYNEEGTGRGPSLPRSLLAVPNVTAHPSTATVPITVLLYSGPLLCDFNVPVKGLSVFLHYHLFVVIFGYALLPVPAKWLVRKTVSSATAKNSLSFLKFILLILWL